VTKDGPYEVEGGVPLARQFIEPNEDGHSWEWRDGETIETGERYRLCRCGRSATKPFCDDSEQEAGFDGTETASHDPYLSQATEFEGPDIVLTDAPRLCAAARFCEAKGQIWNLVEGGGDEATALALRAAAHCPSGRLRTWDGLPEDGQPAGEPDFEPSIGVVEDPAAGVSGPLWVRGGIQVVSADGYEYEVRNRVTLCRCGASRNKPFCDGSHRRIRFRDESVDASIETPG
jgi:CDGSH-type Zn-finger protein